MIKQRLNHKTKTKTGEHLIKYVEGTFTCGLGM